MPEWTSRYVVCVAHTTMNVLPEGFDWDVWIPEEPITDADRLSEFAGRQCYGVGSWRNPAQRTNAEYITNIVQQEHFSVLEHGVVTFALGGISRALTHELIRHRHLSYSQLSQRFVDESHARLVLPPLYQEIPEAQQLLEDIGQYLEAQYVRLTQMGTEHLRRRYPQLPKTLARKRSREAARAVLPNMTETQIVVTGNHRAWREVLLKRGNAHADAEIRALMLDIFPHLSRMAPHIYGDMAILNDPLDGQWSVLQKGATDG